MAKEYTYTKEVDKSGKITLKVQVQKEKFAATKEKTYTRLSQDVKVSGFRPGKAPKTVIESKIGPDLFEKTLNDLLPEVTFDILQEEGLEPLNRLKYNVKKVSDDEGVEYEAEFVEYPKFKLGDMKKIKVKEEAVEVAKEDIDAEKKRILDIYNKQKKAEADSDKKEYTDATELTDAIVTDMKLGMDTVAKLEEQIKHQLEHQKKHLAEDKKVQDMLDEAIKLSKIKVPQAIIDEEIERQEADYKARIEQLGLKLEDFLKAQKTSLDELKKTWNESAEKRIATELLLFEIVKVEKIQVTQEELNREIASIQDPKMKEEYASEAGQRFVMSVILQQKAINWLRETVEGTKEPAIIIPEGVDTGKE